MTLADRRSALIAAALAVIERDGVAGATARAIVNEAGMPLGSLHYAFESVDALLAAAAEEVTTQERLVGEQALTEDVADAGLERMLAAGLEGYVALLVESPGRELAFVELMLHASRSRLSAPPGEGGYSRSYLVVGELLDRAAASAGMQWTVPTAALARHTVSMLDGITTTWLADHDTGAALATARFHASALARLAEAESASLPDPREEQ